MQQNMMAMDSRMLRQKIWVRDENVVLGMRFWPSISVDIACRKIREKMSDTTRRNSLEYGLYFVDENRKKGIWLEQYRPLEYYCLKNLSILEYRCKFRYLKICTVDNAMKTFYVDESLPVSKLMVEICRKIGISNNQEYSLTRESPEDRADRTLRMKKKLRTADQMHWLNLDKSLHDQEVGTHEVLQLSRRFFYTDQTIGTDDPVQLNLLYVQTRDDIVKGTHPVNMEKAVFFAGLQCQVQFGDHSEAKHKVGCISLKDILPKEYSNFIGMKKDVFIEHKRNSGLHEREAKVKYTLNARILETYGITTYVVKEKADGRNRLIPRLLGISKYGIFRMNPKTKEIIETFPLTSIKRWSSTPNILILDFGGYADEYYSVKTSKGEQICQLIAGYINIIVQKQKL